VQFFSLWIKLNEDFKIPPVSQAGFFLVLSATLIFDSYADWSLKSVCNLFGIEFSVILFQKSSFMKLIEMTSKKFPRALAIITMLLINVGCDQISKSAIRQSVGYYERIELISSYLTLTKVENSGAFLSLGDSLPYSIKVILLSIIPVAVLASGLLFLLAKASISKTTLTGACFVIGGGIGNIYDRIVYGSVTDFLHIDFIVFQTGIFNMADVSIMTGVCIVLIDTLTTKKDLAAENVL
jgi:signal peptidase II